MQVQSTQATQAPPPRLRTDETARRDSLSSSRTRDSGYNSDPDISHSPLEFQQDNGEPVSPQMELALTLV